jgi:two-component system, chemotaxis family, sensor kinase CheA
VHEGHDPAAVLHDVEVVVHVRDGRSIGLVVGGVADVVDQPLALDTTGARHGVTGSVVVQGRVTDVLDVDVLAAAIPAPAAA